MNRITPIAAKALAVAVLSSIATLAQAAFPDKPIHLVVPFAPGGSTDVVARRIAPKVGQILGQPIVIENRAGAGGSIASEYVAKSAPDGYVLIMATNSHTANPSLYAKLPYNTRKDFESVVMIGDSPGLFVVNPSVPVNTLLEFIEYARHAHPAVAYGSAGTGTFPHLTMELLKSRAHIEMTHIPYRGAGPAMTDLLGGVYQAKVDAYATSAALLKAHKLKLLAVTSLERMPQLPNTPTVAELGYPGFESAFWMAVLAPAGTPKEVVSRLQGAFIRALHDEKIEKSLSEDGVRVLAKPAAAVDELIDRELKQWPPILKSAGVMPN